MQGNGITSGSTGFFFSSHETNAVTIKKVMMVEVFIR
jgi:hypothetical protein